MGHVLRLALLTAVSGVLCPLGFAGLHDEEAYKYANYLYEQNSAPLYQYTVAEYLDYLSAAPQGRFADDALFRIGRLHERAGDLDRAFLYYLKVIYLHPDSGRVSAATEDIDRIILNVKPLRASREYIDKFLAQDLQSLDYGQRHRAFIAALNKLDHKRLYEPMIGEYKEYLKTQSQAEDGGRIQRDVAHLYEQLKRYHEAVAALEKIRFVYPESGLLSDIQLEIGDIYQYEIKNEYMAKEAYNQALRDYPDSSNVAGTALFRLAEVEERKLKRPDKAIKHLSELVDRYPGNVNAVEALFAKARLLNDSFGDASGAVAALREVTQRFPEDSRAPEALIKAGDYIRSENPSEAWKLYEELADSYPGYRLTPEMLFKAGQLAEKSGKSDEARRLYRKLVDGWPGSSPALKAGKRLKKLG